MLTRALKNSVRDGVKGIGRNLVLSLASVATITVSLIVLGVMYVLIRNINFMSGQIDDTLSIVVFMQEGVSDEEVDAFLDDIVERPEVKKIEYTSADEALEEFRRQLALDGSFDPGVLDFFEENPLADSANIEIYLTSSKDQPALIEYLQSRTDIVRKINYSSNFADVLTKMTETVTIIGGIIILFLIVVTIVLITNTISASIVSRKEEIGIMKFLGAADVYVEGPFVVQGILIGIMGTVIPCLLIGFGYDYLLKVVVEMFGSITAMFTFVPVTTIIAELFPLFGILGVFFSVLGTLISMNKNLRV